MLLERSDGSVNSTSTKITGYSLTYFEGKLGLYPLNLLSSIFLDLCLDSLRGFLSSFEAFHTRVVFLRKLYKRNISQDLFVVGGCSRT